MKYLSVEPLKTPSVLFFAGSLFGNIKPQVSIYSDFYTSRIAHTDSVSLAPQVCFSSDSECDPEF